MEKFKDNIMWLLTTWFGRYIFFAGLTVFGGVLIEHVSENWLTYGIYYAAGAGIVLNLLAQIGLSIIKILKK